MLKTNKKEYRNNFKTELNSILKDADNGENYCKNLNQLLIRFDEEYNYLNNKKRYPNLQKRLSEYLGGLPYGFNFAYKYQILEFAEIVHECKLTEKQENRIIENFYLHCSFMILRLTSLDIGKLY